MDVNTDDLIAAPDVAVILGLAHRQAVSTYRARYADFPEPVVVRGACVLWLRQDVEAWARARSSR